ncbi:MAG: ribosomal-processing cysteine protease Prp [Spirochaetaceae bacterium]|jgi:uncharacterized protein YsxB (DUF464 family)|nr:ribosomal-processing cysteine protease Prp [Spirochaetaceae bacterium]
MIEIDAVLDEGGLLRSCGVKGHARAGTRGNDIVCAAVSVLARTALRALSEKEGIMVRGTAPERGIFRMETEAAGEGRNFLASAGAFLIEGFKLVSEEYPGYCKLRIHTERRN